MIQYFIKQTFLTNSLEKYEKDQRSGLYHFVLLHEKLPATLLFASSHELIQLLKIPV